jgi:hypothetical protein
MTDKPQYDDRNKGALFRNEDKQGDDDRDFSGSIDAEGRSFWISGYLKISKAGQKYIRLVLKPKDAPAEKSKPKAPAAAPLDDTIGF